MDIKNIEEVRILIAKRNNLLDVVNKYEQWRDGHFEFTEHCGSHPDRISLANFPDLKYKIKLSNPDTLVYYDTNRAHIVLHFSRVR